MSNSNSSGSPGFFIAMLVAITVIFDKAITYIGICIDETSQFLTSTHGVEFILTRVLPAIFVLFVLVAIISKIISRFFKQGKAPKVELIRERKLRKKLRRKRKGFMITNKVPVPEFKEPEHSLIIGNAGSGKSTTGGIIVNDLRKDGKKALINDPKGVYYGAFGDPKIDKALGRIKGSATFEIFEMFEDYEGYRCDLEADVSMVANTIVPKDKFKDGDMFVFASCARMMIEAGMLYLVTFEDAKKQNTKALLDLFTLPTHELVEKLKKTRPGVEHNIEEEGITKQGMLITIQLILDGFKFLIPKPGQEVLNIRKWLTDGQPGFIFMPGFENQDVLRPMFTLFGNCMARIMETLPDVKERRWCHFFTKAPRRVYFVLDELESLEYLEAVMRIIEHCRSKGAVLIIFIRSLASLDKHFGTDNKKIILTSTATKLVYRNAGDDVLKELAGFFGQQRKKKDGIQHFVDNVISTDIQFIKQGWVYLIISGQFPALCRVKQLKLNYEKNIPKFDEYYNRENTTKRIRDAANAVELLKKVAEEENRFNKQLQLSYDQEGNNRPNQRYVPVFYTDEEVARIKNKFGFGKKESKDQNVRPKTRVRIITPEPSNGHKNNGNGKSKIIELNSNGNGHDRH